MRIIRFKHTFSSVFEHVDACCMRSIFIGINECEG